MSSDRLKFNVTQLYLTAPAFTRAGDGIYGAVSQAQAQLQDLGAFWGNDDPGQRFAGFYVKDADQLLGLLATVGGAVEGVADAIGRMAAIYAISEEANTSKIRALEWEEP
jgi:hypothetical protein